MSSSLSCSMILAAIDNHDIDNINSLKIQNSSVLIL